MRSRWGDLSDQGVSLLSLFPHRITRCIPGWGWVVGVAGWNTSAAWFRTCWYKFGTLLGPEEIPVCWVFFLVPPLGRVPNASPFLCWWVGVVVLVGWGCGCVLSVA